MKIPKLTGIDAAIDKYTAEMNADYIKKSVAAGNMSYTQLVADALAHNLSWMEYTTYACNNGKQIVSQDEYLKAQSRFLKEGLMYNSGSQAEQYPYGLNQAIHALAVDAWSHVFDYAQYLRYAAERNRVMGNVLAPMTEVAYKAVCAEWEAKIEKNMAKVFSDAVTTGTGCMCISIDEHDRILLEHWDSSIVPVADHLFNQRNHTE